MNQPSVVLLLRCPDARGIVAGVARYVTDYGANIIAADQHRDADDQMFFQRVEFTVDGAFDPADFARGFATVAEQFSMEVDLRTRPSRPRTAILVSQHVHCLVDLLGRAYTGEIDLEPVLVASNHPDHAALVESFRVPFAHIPVPDNNDRAAHERAVAAALAAADVELVVLARYMRVLSPDFVGAWTNRMINIHHSFLPAFAGAAPYRQAHDRGVKVIGATAHYVTATLDEGPIIEQDVTRVSHRDDVVTMTRRGRDLEVAVLARALRAHLEHRVLVWRNRTIVFE